MNTISALSMLHVGLEVMGLAVFAHGGMRVMVFIVAVRSLNLFRNYNLLCKNVYECSIMDVNFFVFAVTLCVCFFCQVECVL